MKNIKIALALSALTFSPMVYADAGVFLGISYAFGGGGPGVSLKVLSSDKEDKAVVGAGATYYPLSSNNQFGLDVGVGYNFNNAGVMVGYDFLQSGIQASVGYVNTDDDHKSNASAATAPVVVTPPPVL